MTEFGLKELYDVVLRATTQIQLGDITVHENEVIAAFDKISISNFNEVKQSVSATGGYGNSTLVTWDTSQQVNLSFAQGIFSKTQFALMMNMKMIHPQSTLVTLHKREVTESDANGIVTTSQNIHANLYVYDKNSGAPVPYTKTDNKHLTVTTPFLDVIVDYDYQYNGLVEQFVVGQPLTQSYVALEGKTKMYDDMTGANHTAIIKMPKLKIDSSLSMQLGEDARPLVGVFRGTAYPVGDRQNRSIMTIDLLQDNIDTAI